MTLTDKSPKPSLKAGVFNRQRKIRLDCAPLRKFAEALAGRLRMRQSFSVVLISDRAMRRLNRRFAGKDRPTDVLSFPCGPEPWPDAGEACAGDVFISVERADAQKRGHLGEELKVLILHGVLHLLGYDHETDRGEMAALESELKEEFGIR